MNKSELIECIHSNTASFKKKVIDTRNFYDSLDVNGNVFYDGWVLSIFACAEKFLKNTCQNYLVYVHDNDITNYDYKLLYLIKKGNDFIKSHEDLEKNFSIKPKSFFLNFINNNKNNNIDFSFNMASIQYCSQILMQINFDVRTLNFDIQSFVKTRNNIAHGQEFQYQFKQNCIDWTEKILHFFDKLTDSIFNHIANH